MHWRWVRDEIGTALANALPVVDVAAAEGARDASLLVVY